MIRTLHTDDPKVRHATEEHFYIPLEDLKREEIQYQEPKGNDSVATFPMCLRFDETTANDLITALQRGITELKGKGR